jgi:hypothetical protein
MWASESLLISLFEELAITGPNAIHYEEQNQAYEGLTFTAANQTFRSRRVKKTPKKKGYFVALWEKDRRGQNQAYSVNSSTDKLVLTILDGHHSGQFIFPRALLIAKGIVKTETTAGKMAFRIYPPWVHDLNTSARKTQKWQLPYFCDLSTPLVDLDKLRNLYLD